jgi:two-component system sensor histidine kinase DegS
MKRPAGWSRWSITTKILVPFLALSVISIAITAYIAVSNIRELGNHALETSTSLGERAIQDSTDYLNRLGEYIITQKAGDIAKQVEMYLETRPAMTMAEMREDAELREIVVQPVGTTGYTTLIDPDNTVIIIHKFPGQEKDISPLMDTLPSFWALIDATKGGEAAAGYYNWLEVDGSIKEKYASIAPVRTADGKTLTLWATTYIDEFSQPAEETKEDISAAILQSSEYISNQTTKILNIFIIFFILLVIIVTVIALLLSRTITRPILLLRKGAEEIGHGKLDYEMEVRSQDELGDLAKSFNNMAADLKRHIEEMGKTAAENIAKERTIQENLRLYVQKVNQAQEAERKRIARELHDDAVQALAVVSRHLDDLAHGHSSLSVEDIRQEINDIARGIRSFSQELRLSILDDLGLITAVQWLASNMTKNYKIAVETKVYGEQQPLPEETELILFRIIQEALSNIRKHSGATEALVLLDFSEQNITVTIKDNGKGFDIPSGVADLASTGRLGLVGMQERAQLLGGTLSIDSQPGSGTSLTVTIPVNSVE